MRSKLQGWLRWLARNARGDMDVSYHASAYPSLIPHNAVVGEHFGDSRPLRQQIELIGCARLELAAILDHRWAGGRDAGLRSDRCAAGQRDRCDREGGEPPRRASGVGRH